MSVGSVKSPIRCSSHLRARVPSLHSFFVEHDFSFVSSHALLAHSSWNIPRVQLLLLPPSPLTPSPPLFRPPARRRRESSGAAARFLWVADASHWTRMASIDALFHSDFGAVEAPSRSVPCRSLSRRYRGRRLVGSPCREGRCAGAAGMRATGVPMWHAFVSIHAEVTFSPRVSHHSFL